MDSELSFVEATEQHRSEPDVPHAVCDFFTADVLLSKRCADVDPAAVPANAVIPADVAHFEVPGISGVVDLLRKRARRRNVELCW